MKRIVSTFSAVAVATLATTLSIGTASAQAPQSDVSPEGQGNLDALNACIQSKGKADILFVLDESASLKGFDGKQPTDPSDLRVDAAGDLLKQISQLGQDTGSEMNVKLAGFGQGYRSDPKQYGNWTNLTADPHGLDSSIQGFKDRKNDMFTVYNDALNGALGDISAHAAPDSCRSVLFFTDGLLTVDGPAEADAHARREMCSSQSPVKAYRQAGVRLFTVGLIPKDEDSPAELLRNMAESDACVPGTKANGAFFNANSNPAELFAAFRSFLPKGANTDFDGRMTEPFQFTLDNSINEVRVSAQPKELITTASVVPYLQSPDGRRVKLDGESFSEPGTKIDVQHGDAVPGMVDVNMVKQEGANWAGEWTFGYEGADGQNADYHATMQIVPGLHTELQNKGSGFSNNEPLKAILVDKEGKPRALEGAALLRAEFRPDDGSAPIPLGEAQSIAAGQPVEIPLNAVAKPMSGNIALTTAIRTAGTPGTELAPIQSVHKATITPVNMPKLPGEASIAVESKESEFTVPVEGPGSIWLSDHSLTDADTVPKGVGKLDLTSDHNSPEKALKLAEGEKAEFPVKVTADSLSDGPLALSTKFNLVSEEGNDSVAVNVPVSGSMRAPVNTGFFIGALIAALLLALAIPLGIFYSIRYLTSTIPRNRVRVRKIQIKNEDSRVIRQDTGSPFGVEYQEIIEQGRATSPNARSIQLGTDEAKVHYPINPLASPELRVSAPRSISWDSKEAKGHAVLPLAVHNHWYLTASPHDPNAGEVTLIVEEKAGEAELKRLSDEVNTKAVSLLRKLDSLNPGSVDPNHTSGSTGFGASRSEGSNNDSESSTVDESSWGESSDGFGSGSFGTDNFGGFGNSSFGGKNDDFGGGFGSGGSSNKPNPFQ